MGWISELMYVDFVIFVAEFVMLSRRVAAIVSIPNTIQSCRKLTILELSVNPIGK